MSLKSLKDGLNLDSMLGIIEHLGYGLGSAGVPFAGIVADVATIADKWVKKEAERSGKTEQEVIASAVEGATGNEAELLKDMARLAAESA